MGEKQGFGRKGEGDLCINGRTILKLILRECNGRVLSEFLGIRTQTRGRLL
jgi:hypothetical protein